MRSFIGSTLDSHSERLQGDLATLLPAARTPDLDLPTVIPDRRPWGAIAGWSLALVAIGGAAFLGWQSWKQGAELAAVRTDLTAAYSELETLRARPEVVSAPPAASEPAASEADVVMPAADAVDAGPAAADAVAVPAATAVVELFPTSDPEAPVSAAPVPPPANASQPQTTQAQ